MKGHICALYFFAPFCALKGSLPLNPKLCFVLEGSRKVIHFWCYLEFCPVAEFSNGQFGLFLPSSHSPLLAKFLERSRNSQNLCLPNRPVFNQSRRSWNSMRWACATQPGLPPLRAQFRLGISTDWSSSLFLGLGEFVWCEHVGFFNINKVSFGSSY